MTTKSTLAVLFLGLTSLVYGQPETKSVTESATKEEIKKAKTEGDDIKFERPINFFAAAGVSFRLQDIYSVAVSPIDKTVQFDKGSPIFSSLTTGLVWNPVALPYKVTYYKDKEKDWRYEYKSLWPCFALLVNVFNLSFSGQQPNSTLPIDVGFGLGYRKDGLCILATCEFTPIRQPRQFFIKGYKDQNKQLIYSGGTDPVTEISPDNNNLFTTKLIPAFGIKVAYAFTGTK